MRQRASWRSTTASGCATTDCCSPSGPSRAGFRSRAASSRAWWICAEVAASARQRGLEVTVIDPLSVPLERVLGNEVGAVYHDIHTDHGVRMLMGTGVEAFEGGAAVERVRTTDGRELECDFVVVGVGVQPRTGLAAQAGIAVDNGILVDEHLETGVPRGVAA